MSYLLFTILRIGLRPSRIRPVVVCLLVGITLLEVLIRDNGPVKVLLVPSEEQRFGPTIGPRGTWVLTRGGLTRCAMVTLHGG